ncbi:YfcE family phosphodiesterase [Vitiosangium sp. GDMCC 1.1324]|nr:YfcE family phosphodiesterase [Vitiosangium sp. GDMCC 1.1324]
MKIAAVSDIHGNVEALEAVLADIDRRGADVIVNLGDIVSGPLQPRETADLLMSLGLPTIRGNHERQLLGPDLERIGPSDRHTAQSLRPDQRDWISSLPPTLWLSDEVFLCHGTPGDDLTYFLEQLTTEGCEPAPAALIEERAGDCTASLILCGHTHIPRAVRLRDGRTIVNPGSVGLQAYEDDLPHPHRVEVGSPHARYALIERTAEGWATEFLSVVYDWERAARLAEARDRRDWSTALRTGRL